MALAGLPRAYFGASVDGTLFVPGRVLARASTRSAPLRRCELKRMAAAVSPALSGGGRVVGNGIEVTEPIDLKGAAGFDFKRSLYIENFHFCYDVSLANCSYDGGVTFSTANRRLVNLVRSRANRITNAARCRASPRSVIDWDKPLFALITTSTENCVG